MTKDAAELTAAAYSSIAVVSGLVFGFALSAFTQVVPGNAGASTPLLNWFLLLTSVVIILSGMATLVFSLQYYYITRLSVRNPDEVGPFIHDTYAVRHVARGATVISMILVLPAVGLLALDRLPVEYGALMMVALCLGAAIMFAIWMFLRKAFCTKTKVETAQSQSEA